MRRVSVSMLTEGWDANTVTHILGVRAFGTQLLCEQVVGRGLRRMSYHAARHVVALPDGSTADCEAFPVEYAEVYGVPFSFIPSAGSSSDPKPGPIPTRVRALDDRLACEITFPRIDAYRYDLPAERLTAVFNKDSRLVLSTEHLPTKVENAPIVGETSIHTWTTCGNAVRKKSPSSLPSGCLNTTSGMTSRTRSPGCFPTC